MLMPAPISRFDSTIPSRAGVGLRAAHYQDVLACRPATGWFEVHSENYFGNGGRPLFYLEHIRADYPISLHGVGMSLGSTDPLNVSHLRKLKQLIERIDPGLVSDHLSFSSVDGRYVNDLLPLPYTEEALYHVSERVVRAQDVLGRRILVENVSSYLQYSASTIAEPEFLAELARRSGCGILLDVNNVYVSARNHGFDPLAFLRAIPRQAVAELHLAGHSINRFDDGELLIDTHSRPVSVEVWSLYCRALERFGRMPTLIEWDAELPPLDILVDEAAKAEHLMEAYDELAA